MREIVPDRELASLLVKFDAIGGVVDYIAFELATDGSNEKLHRDAALFGIAAIARRADAWAVSRASDKRPVESFFRVAWDDAKLAGEPIPFATFWGTDDVEPKYLDTELLQSIPNVQSALTIPNVDGYKTAFFHPPYGLSASKPEQARLFSGINQCLLGDRPDQAEIFSWSTNWSNYFDAGHEWWGAFFWTIRPMSSRRMVVIGASSTD